MLKLISFDDIDDRLQYCDCGARALDIRLEKSYSTVKCSQCGQEYGVALDRARRKAIVLEKEHILNRS